MINQMMDYKTPIRMIKRKFLSKTKNKLIQIKIKVLIRRLLEK